MRSPIDVETRNPELDVTKVGAYVYGADPRTEITAVSWSVDGGLRRRWLPLLQPEMPTDLRETIQYIMLDALAFGNDSSKFVAHNVDFERNVLSGPAGQRLGFPDMMPIKIWDDTAARGAAFGLPRSLEAMAAALGLEVRKDSEGRALMLKMTKLRKPRKAEAKALNAIHGSFDVDEVARVLAAIPGARCPGIGIPFDSNTVILWHETPEQQERQGLYCETDIEVTEVIDKILPPLSAFEQEVWELTSEMNDAGVPVDIPLLGRMQAFVDEAIADIDAEISKRTRTPEQVAYDEEHGTVSQGAVQRVSDHGAITRWLDKQGINDALTVGVAKAAIAAYLENPDIDGLIREILLLRQEGGGTAFTKWAGMDRRVSADGTVKGALMYCGAASTGRWSSRGLQLQNIIRGGTIKHILRALEDIMAGAKPSEVALVYGPPLIVSAELIRPAIISPSDDYWLARGDYSQIEARMNPWLCGAEWKLEAFRKYDAGLGPDIYRVMAAKFYHITPDQVTSPQRQGAGKVPELALGFQGGEGALANMGKAYGVKFTEKESTDIKVGWRSDNPEIVSFWRALNKAAVQCMQSPIGTITPVVCLDEEWNPRFTCPITFFRTRRAMAMRLPSGRPILYWTPELIEVPVPWGGTRPAVQYRAEDPETKQWTTFVGYGGLYCNNAVQGSARDVMAMALLRLKAANLAGPRVLGPRLCVHDEGITAVLKSLYPRREDAARVVADIMLQANDNFPGLPLAVEASAGPRYLKAA